MPAVANKRSIMTLYSDPMDIYCHRVRIVLAEKGVNVEVIEINPDDKPEDLVHLNPYNFVPTLVDRDLVIYESKIISEYLDERFPHPPLMPVYPVARAEHRRMMYRIERDIYSLLDKLHDSDEKKREKTKKTLQDILLAIAPLFAEKPFFMSEEFSLVDCCFAPLLWRLPLYGIELPAKQAKSIYDYQKRIFERDSFQASLSEAEMELRE